jgi:hypothetical protein
MFCLCSCSEGSETDSEDSDPWAIQQGAKHQQSSRHCLSHFPCVCTAPICTAHAVRALKLTRKTETVLRSHAAHLYCSHVYRSSSDGSETDSEDSDPWAIQQGAKHQAVIPALRQRPAAGPTASEAKFLSAPVSPRSLSLFCLYCLCPLFALLVPLMQ